MAGLHLSWTTSNLQAETLLDAVFGLKSFRPDSSIRALERIMFSRNHFVVSAIYVNPLTIIWLDQIHRTDGSPQTIPSKPDLI
jgi:hypothetical protein